MPGHDLEARFQARPQEQPQPEAEATGGTASGQFIQSGSMGCGGDVGKATEGRIGGRQILGAQSLLGAIHAAAPAGPEQRVVDIDGHGDGQGEGRLGRRPAMEAFQPCPGFDRSARIVEEAPSHGPGQAEAGVVGGAAADAHEHLARSGLQGGRQRGAEARGVEVEGVEAAGRELGEPDDGRRFDEGEPGVGLVPPMGPDGAVGRIHRVHATPLGSEAFGQDRSEAVSAIADRQQGECVVRPATLPALGDGRCGGGGGEGALELVGNDEDAERHRLRGWSAKGPLGKLANGSNGDRRPSRISRSALEIRSPGLRAPSSAASTSGRTRPRRHGLGSRPRVRCHAGRGSGTDARTRSTRCRR